MGAKTSVAHSRHFISPQKCFTHTLIYDIKKSEKSQPYQRSQKHILYNNNAEKLLTN